MLFWGQIPGVQFFFSGAEAELTNRVPVRDFNPGAPLTQQFHNLQAPYTVTDYVVSHHDSYL